MPTTEAETLALAGELMRQSSAADYLRVSRACISGWVKQGRLRAETVNGKRMVFRDEIEAMNAERGDQPRQPYYPRGPKSPPGVRKTVRRGPTLTELERRILLRLVSQEVVPVVELATEDTPDNLRAALGRLDCLDLATPTTNRSWRITSTGQSYLAES